MTIPGQTITVEDPGLGLTVPAQNIPLFMGACSSGTADTVVSFSKPSEVGAVLGEGPLVEYVTRALLVSGGPVLAMRLAATVVGLPGTVATTGGGPTITIAGAAFDSYQGVLTIVAGGILGAGTFTYSLDGGTTTSPALLIPAGGSFPIPGTNTTLTFPAGTYVAADTYTWTSVEPQNNPADTLAGFAALLLLNETYDYICLTTTYASAANAATAFAALNSELTTLFNAFEYKGAIMDGGPDAAAGTVTAFAASESTRICVGYSTATAPSGKPFVGRGTRVSSLALVVAIEASKQLISTDLARVANKKLGGTLSPVTAIGFNSVNDATVDAAKFATARTLKGKPGFFLTNANIMSPDGSDYAYWQHRRIMDEASETIQVEQQDFLSRSVRTLPTTNYIDERDGTRLETPVRTALRVKLTNPRNAEGTQGHVTGFDYAIDRTNDVLTTQTILSTFRAKPHAYVKYITSTIGYSATLLSDVPEEEAA